MVVKEKNVSCQENIEKALYSLAGLVGIPLERGWKLAIAEFFDVPQSLVSQWINRGNLPKSRLAYAEKKGYALSRWYRVKTNYHVMPETSGQTSKDNQRSPTSEPYTLEETCLDNMAPKQVHLQINAKHAHVISKVKAILESNEQDTIDALTSNVREFHQKIIEKKEFRQAIKRQQEMEWTLRRQSNELESMRVFMEEIKEKVVEKK